MKCIDCGIELPKMIVINTKLYSLSVYISWRKDNEGLCLKCYADKNKVKKSKAI